MYADKYWNRVGQEEFKNKNNEGDEEEMDEDEENEDEEDSNGEPIEK